MKIRKKTVETKIVKKLEQLNEIYSIEEIASMYEVGRNTIGEILRLKLATQPIIDKISEKMFPVINEETPA